MVQATAREVMKLETYGMFDWRPLQANFENVFNDMKHNSQEITALAQRQTWTIVKMFEDTGPHEIMAANKHLRCRCVSVSGEVDRDAFVSLENVISDSEVC